MDMRMSTVESVARWKQKVETRKAAAAKAVNMSVLDTSVVNQSEMNILRESWRGGLINTEIGKGTAFPNPAYDRKSDRKNSNFSKSTANLSLFAKEKDMKRNLRLGLPS